MTIKHIKDSIFDFTMEIAWDVFERSDSILSEASEGLLDDGHEEVNDNARDIIMDMINERLK